MNYKENFDINYSNASEKHKRFLADHKHQNFFDTVIAFCLDIDPKNILHNGITFRNNVKFSKNAKIGRNVLFEFNKIIIKDLEYNDTMGYMERRLHSLELHNKKDNSFTYNLIGENLDLIKYRLLINDEVDKFKSRFKDDKEFINNFCINMIIEILKNCEIFNNSNTYCSNLLESIQLKWRMKELLYN